MAQVITGKAIKEMLEEIYGKPENNNIDNNNNNANEKKGNDKMTKLTKKQALTIALDALKYAGNEIEVKGDWTIEDVQNKIGEMIAQLDKASTSPRKPSKSQEENAQLKQEIKNMLESMNINHGNAKSASEIAEKVGISTSKASALLRQMVESGQVQSEKGKKSNLYWIG